MYTGSLGAHLNYQRTLVYDYLRDPYPFSSLPIVIRAQDIVLHGVLIVDYGTVSALMNVSY
jgi:hypothetical protein